MDETQTQKYSFKGWDTLTFLKGQRKTIITLIGAGAAYWMTQDPAVSGVIGAALPLLYSAIEFWLKE